MNRNINTILFDLDGTLVNTNDLIIASFTDTLNRFYPNKYNREQILQFIGPPLVESFNSVDPQRAAELVAHYREHNYRHHDLLVKEYEGVFETVESLKQQGYKLGIVSTKIREGIYRGLKAGRIDPFFDVIVGLDDVTAAKPDPEPIHKALHLLGSTPAEAMMVGDNHHDIEAGKNAGVLTAGVAWTVKGREYLNTFNPDYMLENMRDLLDILQVKAG